MIYKRVLGLLSGHFFLGWRAHSRSLSPHFTTTARWELTTRVLFFFSCLSLPLLPLIIALFAPPNSTSIAVLFKCNFHILFPHQEINTACKYRSCVFYCQTMSVTCKNILSIRGTSCLQWENVACLFACVCVCVCALLLRRGSRQSAFLFSTVWICVGLCGRRKGDKGERK